MLFVKLLLSILFLFAVPCYAPNPTVTISRGINEDEVKDVKAVLGMDGPAVHTIVFWQFTFQREALRMLPYALSLLSTKRWNDPTKFIKKSELAIGAIVSISGNGGGIFKLMAMLNKKGYTKLTIIVIVNPKENKEQSTTGDKLAFDEIINYAKFSDTQLFYLTDKNTKTYHTFKSIDVPGAVDALKKTKVLFDGICGGGYHATTLKDEYTEKPITELALTILPLVAPANVATEIQIVSNATPSGRTEKGDWIKNYAFACHSIMSTTFPLNAMQVDKPTAAENPEVKTKPENIWLLEGPTETNPATGKDDSFFTALMSEVPTLVDDFNAILAVIKPATKWISVVAS